MILGGMRSSGTLSDSTVKRMYGEEATLQSLQDMPADAFTELAMKRLDREPMRFKVTVLGSVREGDLVHYVLRTHAEGEGTIVDAVDVTTLRPWGNTWRANLKTHSTTSPPPRARLPEMEPPPPPPRVPQGTSSR